MKRRRPNPRTGARLSVEWLRQSSRGHDTLLVYRPGDGTKHELEVARTEAPGAASVVYARLPEPFREGDGRTRVAYGVLRPATGEIAWEDDAQTRQALRDQGPEIDALLETLSRRLDPGDYDV